MSVIKIERDTTRHFGLKFEAILVSPEGHEAMSAFFPTLTEAKLWCQYYLDRSFSEYTQLIKFINTGEQT